MFDKEWHKRRVLHTRVNTSPWRSVDSTEDEAIELIRETEIQSSESPDKRATIQLLLSIAKDNERDALSPGKRARLAAEKGTVRVITTSETDGAEEQELKLTGESRRAAIDLLLNDSDTPHTTDRQAAINLLTRKGK